MIESPGTGISDATSGAGSTFGGIIREQAAKVVPNSVRGVLGSVGRSCTGNSQSSKLKV